MPIVDRHAPGSFSWFELATTDQNAAKNFYTSLFGWTADDNPMGPGQVYSMFRIQGRDAAAAYTLQPEQRAQGVPPHWNLYVTVENADESARRAGDLAGKVVVPPFDVMDLGRMAVIADPTGAHFCLWQPKKHPGVGITGENGAFSWADLNSPDAAAATRFYSGLFGWEFAKDENDPDPSGYLHIKNGEHYIGGMPRGKQAANIPPHWLVYFHVSDCEASSRKARNGGAQVLLPTMALEHVGRFAVLKDPQGAAFALFEPEKKD